MADTIITFLGVVLIVVVAFGLTALAAVTIANAKVVKRGRGEQEPRREPPSQSPDGADFKRGA